MDNKNRYVNMCVKWWEQHPELLKDCSFDDGAFVSKREYDSVDDDVSIYYLGDYIFSLEGAVDAEEGFKEPVFSWDDMIPILSIDGALGLLEEKPVKELVACLYHFMYRDVNLPSYNYIVNREDIEKKCRHRRDVYKTLEQKVLGFVASEMFDETWNGEQWVVE